MKFVYKPEGADPREWEFDPARLMSPEVEAIERHTGLAFAEWIEAVGKGSFLAYHGLLYVLLKRSVPTLKWDDVQFCMADLDLQLNDEEESELLTRLLAKREAGDITGEESIYLDGLLKKGVEPAPLED